jgi:hypothetical protein
MATIWMWILVLAGLVGGQWDVPAGPLESSQEVQAFDGGNGLPPRP